MEDDETLKEFFKNYKKVISGSQEQFPYFKFYNNEELKNPYVWGPVYWNILHNLAFKIDSLPNIENIKLTMEFLNILKHLNEILPCDSCASSYVATFENASKLKLFYEQVDFKKNEMLQKLLYYLHSCVNIKKIGADKTNTLQQFMDEINSNETMYQTFHRLHPNLGFLFYDESKKLRKPINIKAFTYFYKSYYKNEHKVYRHILHICKYFY